MLSSAKRWLLRPLNDPPYLPLYITFISAFSCKITSNAKVLGSSDWTLVDVDQLGHDLAPPALVRVGRQMRSNNGSPPIRQTRYRPEEIMGAEQRVSRVSKRQRLRNSLMIARAHRLSCCPSTWIPVRTICSARSPGCPWIDGSWCPLMMRLCRYVGHP